MPPTVTMTSGVISRDLAPRLPAPRPARSAPSRRDRRLMGALAGLVIALAVPYALAGPGLLMDDWWVLRNRRFSGVLATAGHRQLLARPGAWLVFTFDLGTIGRHPLILFLVQTAVNAAAAVLIYVALRRFLSPGLAFAVPALRAILPNHAAMDHWASNMGAVVCLLLLAAGTVVLERAVDRNRSMALAVCCFVGSALCYEASLPLSAALLFFVPLRITGRVRWRETIGAVGALAVTGSWMIGHTAHPVPSGFADLGLLPSIHFGRGIVGSPFAAQALMTVAAGAIALAILRLSVPRWRALTGSAEWLVVGGLAIILLGTLAFLKFPIAPYGMGDRATVVSGMGGAMVWTGVGAMVWRWRRGVAIGSLVVFCSLALPTRLQRDHDWHRAGADANRLVHILGARSDPAAAPIVVGPRPLSRNGVIGLYSDWDTTAALQLERGDTRLRAGVAHDAGEFERAGRRWRQLVFGRRQAG
ncbi:MAG: hypothetical protein ACYDAD_04905 [Acidimicrobiales bacterium]